MNYSKFMNKSVLSATLIALLLAGCSEQAADSTPVQPTAPATEASKPVATQKTYLVALDASYAPYALRNETGGVIGFDADLLNAIAAKQGFQLKFLNHKWKGIFDTLDTGERDIIASGAAITPERKANMDFSDPYLRKIRSAVVIDKTVNTFDDLANKRVATQDNSTEKTAIESYFNKSDNLVLTSTVYLALKEMAAGKADAAFGDAGVSSYYVKNSFSNLSLRMMPMPGAEESPEYLGFAIKKGRDDLRQKLNQGLKEIKADGTYQALYEKWFGHTEIDLTVE